MKATKNLLILSLAAATISCVQKPAEIAIAAPKANAQSFFKNRPIVVAVIDTGLHESLMNSRFVCKMGHKDFTGTGLHDTHGHGTHISGVIDQYVKDKILSSKNSIKEIAETPAEYCQVILKYWSPTVKDALSNEIKALQHAINIKVDVINFSGGGLEFSKEEQRLIKVALDMGIKVIVAAGNEKSDLAKSPYYPAMVDSRLDVVGNLANNNVRAPSSNYGEAVDTWEYGVDVRSYCAIDRVCIMTGTSQATAIKTGKVIRAALSK